MNRRHLLAAVATGAAASTSGCLGGSTEEHPALEVDREPDDPDAECVERELLDFERVSLAPRLAGPVGLPTAEEWTVSLEEGEELYLRITNPDAAFLPHLTVEDPDGTALVDERPVDNIYTIPVEAGGRHTIEVRNRRWSEGEVWFVDLHWYSASGCRR